MKQPIVKTTLKMNTYNVELRDDPVGVQVIEALNCGVSTSGALVFKGRDDVVVEAFNAEKWIHVWKI